MQTRVRTLLPALLPIVCLLLAFGLRLVDLGHLGLWGDEGWSVYLAHRSLADLTAETGYDIHPPLYYYLLYLWRRLSGSGEFAVRYLSVFPGTLVVSATFATGRRLAGTRVGAAGAALVACAPFAVYYSQEARPFMWATLWCVCALYALWHALASESRAAWTIYALLSLLSAFTLYSTAMWFAAHGVLLLVARDWRRRLPTWLSLEVGVLALSLPWLLVFGRVTGDHLVGQGAFTAREVLPVHVLMGRMVAGLSAGVTLSPTAAWIMSGVVLVTGIGGAIVAGPRAWRTAVLLIALTLLPVLALYPIHTMFPWFEPRVLAFCVVPLCLLLAVGLDGWLTRGRWALAIASAILAVVYGIGLHDYFVRYSRYSPELEDYRPLIAIVQQQAMPGDVVLYNAPWHVGYFEAYYHGAPLEFCSFSAASVTQITHSPGQVWLILRDIVRQPGGHRPEDRAEDLLSVGAFKVGETWFGHIRMAHYVIAPGGELAYHPLGLLLGGDLPASPEVRLDGFTVQPEPEDEVLVIEPGQAIYLTLTWQAERSLDDAYQVFAHLVGPYNPARGNPLWAQHDGLPGNQERPTIGWTAGERITDRHVMWVDVAAPPGEYTLETGMYDPATGLRLAVMQADGVLSDHVVLTRVRMVAP